MKILTSKLVRRICLLFLLIGSIYYGKTKHDILFKENVAVYREISKLKSYISLLEKTNESLTEQNREYKNEVARRGLETIAASIHPRIALLQRSNKNNIRVYQKGCKATLAVLESKIFKVRDDKNFTDTQKQYLMLVIKHEMMFHLSVCHKALDDL